MLMCTSHHACHIGISPCTLRHPSLTQTEVALTIAFTFLPSSPCTFVSLQNNGGNSLLVLLQLLQEQLICFKPKASRTSPGECTRNSKHHDGLGRQREKRQYVITRGPDVNVEIMTII